MLPAVPPVTDRNTPAPQPAQSWAGPAPGTKACAGLAAARPGLSASWIQRQKSRASALVA